MNAALLAIHPATQHDRATRGAGRRAAKQPPTEPFARKLARSVGDGHREASSPAREARGRPLPGEEARRPACGSEPETAFNTTAPDGSAAADDPVAPEAIESGVAGSMEGDGSSPAPAPPTEAPAVVVASAAGNPPQGATVGDLAAAAGASPASSERPSPSTPLATTPADAAEASAGPTVGSGEVPAADPSGAAAQQRATSPYLPAGAGEVTRGTRPTDDAAAKAARRPGEDAPTNAATPLPVADVPLGPPAEAAGEDPSSTDAASDGSKVADAAGRTMSRLSATPGGEAGPPPVAHATTTTHVAVASKAASSAPPAMQQPAPTSHDDDALARQNIDRIVTSMRGELLPRGGSMQIRLDPPQLGSLQVSVRVQDGVLSASFQTSSEQATQMLGQTMTQLKSALEASGVSVERLHVQQAPATRSGDDARGGPGDGRQHASSDQQSWAQGEQQRREMLQRMWRRLGLGEDPLDLVA